MQAFPTLPLSGKKKGEGKKSELTSTHGEFSSSKLSPLSPLLFTWLLFVSHLNFSMLLSECEPSLLFCTIQLLAVLKREVSLYCLLHFAVVQPQKNAGFHHNWRMSLSLSMILSSQI